MSEGPARVLEALRRAAGQSRSGEELSSQLGVSRTQIWKHMETLRGRGVGIVEPGSGYLACGWLGKGRLAEVADIVDAAMRVLLPRRDLDGRRVLVSAGPTIEDIDPVRYISNRSSGRMGYAIAAAAQARGADVTLVSGPVELPAPADVEVVAVRSAKQMASAVKQHAEHADVVVMAAAVADYRPASTAPEKLKKQEGSLTLDLERTEDILAGLGGRAGRTLVGFTAETEKLREHARLKLEKKRLDLIVANDVSQKGAGFGGDQNAALLIDASGGETEVPLVSKRELADRIWDRVAELRAARPQPIEA